MTLLSVLNFYLNFLYFNVTDSQTSPTVNRNHQRSDAATANAATADSANDSNLKVKMRFIRDFVASLHSGSLFCHVRLISRPQLTSFGLFSRNFERFIEVVKWERYNVAVHVSFPRFCKPNCRESYKPRDSISLMDLFFLSPISWILVRTGYKSEPGAWFTKQTCYYFSSPCCDLTRVASWLSCKFHIFLLHHAFLFTVWITG